MFLDLSGVHATRWCSVVYPKNDLGPIAASTSVLDALNRPEQCSWNHLAVALHPHQTESNLKKVPGPIQSSRHSLVLWRLPEKCSWTYRSVSLRPRRVESTGTMFLDPSRRCSPPSPNCVQPEKCSWTYSGIAPLFGHRRCIPE